MVAGGSFIDSVLDAIDAFYSDVMQNLRAWTATPPKLRADGDKVLADEQDVASPLVSTALSSQDGAIDDDSDAAAWASGGTRSDEDTAATEPSRADGQARHDAAEESVLAQSYDGFQNAVEQRGPRHATVGTQRLR